MQVMVNGQERMLPDGSTVDWLLGSLRGEARDGRGVAVALDGEVVPRSAWSTTELQAGAAVEVLIAVQGG